MAYVRLDVDNREITALKKMVIRDTDTADENALRGMLWQIAKDLKLIDDEGNPLF